MEDNNNIEEPTNIADAINTIVAAPTITSPLLSPSKNRKLAPLNAEAWQPDETCSKCTNSKCQQEFTLLRRLVILTIEIMI